ncbi:hypothetical protein AVMA1855_14930 [Acidovorax sp. SUPP1855]|uniref:hypothetical protein n=1 Tax=unclassified Acidovorax TaxID=2684926 RepID=UPI0023DE35F3|nr:MULTISPECIES: hypothetical protein [unclassified Acidovorax]GKS85460.1 hypothetical protein AVMA1855_14930 [Acidovorax sp. SUPP1855]GKT00381.1 hypothetical protein AVKW3434_13350 [Acidovorax sp. SUPP3434]
MHSIRFFSSTAPFALSAMAALLMAPGLSRTAHAVECRAIATVQHSAVSANNNADGGHLNQHVFGATPPKGSSQKDKTLFSSVGEYSGFWNNYQDPKKYKGTAVDCSGTHARQKVTVYSVLKKDLIGGFNCTAANANGECTTKTKSQFSNIQLDFEVVGGKWILLTAYPTN